MTIQFLKSIMRIPSCSGHEDLVQGFVMQWAKSNGVQCSEDGKGNLYLTKGSSEWYPCVAAHMDTVFDEQAEYVKLKKPLPIKIDGDRMYVDADTGIGADDKAGVAICLDAMSKLPACKAVFFVEEEREMRGSRQLDPSFFEDVSYCIAWDSPGWNRATKALAGVELFSQDFFERFIKPVADEFGVTNFRREPYSDMYHVVKKTGTTCMNFSNGGYNPHERSEYLLVSETMKASEFCLALISAIPADRKYRQGLRAEEDVHEYGDRKLVRPGSVGLTLEFDTLEQVADYWQALAGKRVRIYAKETRREGHELGDATVKIAGERGEIEKAYTLFFNLVDGCDYETYEELLADGNEAPEFIALY